MIELREITYVAWRATSIGRSFFLRFAARTDELCAN